MADSDIVENMTALPGQSQSDRVAPQLGVHYANVDHRSARSLLEFTRAFAPMVNFYRADSAFSVTDFVAASLPGFAARLKTPTDPVASFFSGLLSKATSQDLGVWNPAQPLPSSVPAELAADISAIVAGTAIYGSGPGKFLFGGVALRPQTAMLMAQGALKGPDLALLNRLLIEDSFPGTFAAGWFNALGFGTATSDQLLASGDGTMPAHQALLLAFLELYKQPQDIINLTTGNHLDFYYKRVLQIPTKAAVPDKVHVILDLKNKASPVNVTPANIFSGGKDPTGVELLYAPTGQTIVNLSSVASLRSLFVDSTSHGTVRSAPIANSSDGVGGALDPADPKWNAFGTKQMPAAEVGFAIASPVLRMAQGTRNVTVRLTVSGTKSALLNKGTLKDAFSVYLTGTKGWLGPYVVSPELGGSRLQFGFGLLPSDTAVADYNAAIHGYSYVAQAPLVQVLLNTASSAKIGYKDFSNVVLKSAQISVSVSGVTSLDLENDVGTLDPTKAFQPFGPQPAVGSLFMVGSEEALSKKLTRLEIDVNWKGVNPDLATYYANYPTPQSGKTFPQAPNGNSYFTAKATFTDGGGWTKSESMPLFGSPDATSQQAFAFSKGSGLPSAGITAGMEVFALSYADRTWSREAAEVSLLRSPVLYPYLRPTAAPAPAPAATPASATSAASRSGFVTFSLETDFMQTGYRTQYVSNLMTYSKAALIGNKPVSPVDGSTPLSLVILNDPYVPVIQSISLSYDASSDDVGISTLGTQGLKDFSNPDIQFFQVAYFGQIREHGYQRQRFDFVLPKTVSLLAPYGNEGEFIVGLAGLNPGDSVSVLFQVAEGSADPDLEREDVKWSVLCDNYWKALDKTSVVLDTTNQLLTSGVIRFLIPEVATTDNTILPSGQVWLKAGVLQQVQAICQLIDVEANAVEVRFTDNGNDPNHLSAPLAAGSIAKMKVALSAVKTVAQPYASFGGCPAEAGSPYYTRVSERLRHKDRCVTPWDYERVILAGFPGVHRVKCIPHSKKGSWLAPGNVTIIVIPDLRNQNAVDPLQPKVDLNTLTQITSWVQERAWAQSGNGAAGCVLVKNPSYVSVKVDFKVSFLAGYEYSFYQAQLNQRIIEFLCPWAYGTGSDINFGGTIYKSVILDFIQDIGYVDFVTDFKMYTFGADGVPSADLDAAVPDAPDAILVSAAQHTIGPAT